MPGKSVLLRWEVEVMDWRGLLNSQEGCFSFCAESSVMAFLRTTGETVRVSDNLLLPPPTKLGALNFRVSPSPFSPKETERSVGSLERGFRAGAAALDTTTAAFSFSVLALPLFGELEID